MTKRKIHMQAGSRGVFAQVTVTSRPMESQSPQVLISDHAFDYLIESHGEKTWFPSSDCFLRSASEAGAHLALKDLSISHLQIVIESIYFHLVDATRSGFALAAYEATYEELSGMRRIKTDMICAHDLEAIEARLDSK